MQPHGAHLALSHPRAPQPVPAAWPTAGQRGLLPTPARPRAPGRLSSYAAFALEGGHTPGLAPRQPAAAVSGHRSEVAFTVADDDAVRPSRALADAGRAHRATACRRSLRIDLRRPGSRRSSHPGLPALNVAVFTHASRPGATDASAWRLCQEPRHARPDCRRRPHRIARHVRARPAGKVVIVVPAGSALGQAANAVACIAAGLARACPGPLGRCGMWTDCNHPPSRTCPSSSSAPVTRRWPRCATAAHGAAPAAGWRCFPPMRKASTTATPIGNATGIRASRPAHAGHRVARGGGQRTDGQPADAALGRRDGTRPRKAVKNVGTP